MIVIPDQGRVAIYDHARRSYPEECCGLLAGTRAQDDAIRIRHVVPSANVAETRLEDRFEVDPQVRFDLMRHLQGTEFEIVGHYHSHPDGPAEPSETDKSMAFEPDMIWLICRVTAIDIGPIQAWQIEGGPNRAANAKSIPLFLGGTITTANQLKAIP